MTWLTPTEVIEGSKETKVGWHREHTILTIVIAPAQVLIN